MTLRLFFILLSLLLLLSCSEETPTNPFKIIVPDGWDLVWNDEFDAGTVPNPALWDYDEGGSGWGNGEDQYYTKNRPENARIEDDKLIIEARKESFGGNDYTSARLVTRGKGDWLYGRIEVRAKLPAGIGTWPAIWMLPTDREYGGWPNSGEIDIMEHVGYDPNVIHGSIHTESYNHKIGTQRSGTITVGTATTDFHKYAIEWSADKIDFFVDDLHYFTFQNEKTSSKVWPFDKRFYLILNLAIGGSWGGARGIDDSIFPVRMEVDYVRVMKKK